MKTIAKECGMGSGVGWEWADGVGGGVGWCRIHTKSAPDTNSKAVSWHPKPPARTAFKYPDFGVL